MAGVAASISSPQSFQSFRQADEGFQESDESCLKRASEQECAERAPIPRFRSALLCSGSSAIPPCLDHARIRDLDRVKALSSTDFVSLSKIGYVLEPSRAEPSLDAKQAPSAGPLNEALAALTLELELDLQALDIHPSRHRARFSSRWVMTSLLLALDPPSPNSPCRIAAILPGRQLRH
ncbi:hypothetical protein MARPO_0010s0202 [Marchantia polymorpha]|uniref:Uncharacterized protein n=1 Tax=Marchantia polymorpha TaxID=3197 RepID=A0A2R6XL42_MARPO|nr:hypothetical protein MARPO_0010s0202 [Marchantia polymorpha]|eukprot:PTQ46835.1 hypothetical protein MARPO_0010s0202 [Marchantia polymorpha]